MTEQGTLPATSFTGTIFTRGRRRSVTYTQEQSPLNPPYLINSDEDVIGVLFVPARINLPDTPKLGDEVEVKDITGDAGANPITVFGNGNTINGAPSAVLDQDWGSLLFSFTGNGNWQAVALGSSGGGANPVYLSQTEFHVNLATGDDANDGLTSLTPLQHIQEVQRRLGTFQFVQNPTQITTVFLEGPLDFPEDDPITFRSFIGNGGVFIVRGTARVRVTGTFTAVTPRAGNTPWSVDSAAVADWSIHRGRILRVTSGPGIGSYVVIEKGVAAGQVSEWIIDGPVESGASSPGTPPGIGDSFQIIDFTRATLAAPIGGGLDNDATGPAGIPAFISYQLNLNSPVEISLGTSLGVLEFGWYYTQCIFESFFVTNMLNVALNGCAWRGGGFGMIGGRLFISSGAAVPDAGTAYPGGLRIEGQLQTDGHVQFVGEAGSGTYADIQFVGSEALITSGPMGFYDCFHTLVLSSASAYYEDPSPFYGAFGTQQLYGNTNGANIFLFNQNALRFSGFDFGVFPPLPSLELAGGAGTPAIAIRGEGFNEDQGVAWDHNTVAYSAAEIDTTWANFGVAFPAGFQTDADATRLSANAQDPASFNLVAINRYNV